MSEWRDIPGYDGMYQVSRDGMVRSWRKPFAGNVRAEKPRMMAAYVRGGKRYSNKHTGRKYCVNLIRDGKRTERTVASIMAEVWLGGRPKGLVAYHKNGDVGDNSVENIVFVTPEKLGRISGRNSARKPVAMVDENGEVLEVYPSATAAANANYMDIKSVTNRCKGKIKNQGDYRFVFDT
jgi:hypothetical protein